MNTSLLLWQPHEPCDWAGGEAQAGCYGGSGGEQAWTGWGSVRAQGAGKSMGVKAEALNVILGNLAFNHLCCEQEDDPLCTGLQDFG